MSFKFAIPLAVTAASLLFAGSSRAATYTEGATDAGDLPATAAVVIGVSGTSLTSITGVLSLTNGLSESDMYGIRISNPATFSVSDTAFSPGSNNFDSQIMLFNASGLGIAVNDDDAVTDSPQSNIPAGSSQITSLTPGFYYLLISGSGRYATSSGGLIFPNYTDGTTDPSLVLGPTGPGGASSISGYTGNSSNGGQYVLALTGAQVVPEPATLAFVVAGAFGTVLLGRARRRTSN